MFSNELLAFKSTIQSLIQRELLINHGVSTSDRRAALQVLYFLYVALCVLTLFCLRFLHGSFVLVTQVARSLHSQLFFYEVEWGGRVLQDGVEDVYMFLDDLDGGAGELLVVVPFCSFDLLPLS